jgi:hypothetical protein
MRTSADVAPYTVDRAAVAAETEAIRQEPVTRVVPTSPVRSGRPDDKLRETRGLRASLTVVPGFRFAQSGRL